MSTPYYKPCRELDTCNELIETYFNAQQNEKCFKGHLVLAKQGYDLAIEKCRKFGIGSNAPVADREAARKDLQCRIYPLGYLERYKYTVICTSYEGKWVLSRHRSRNTWETQGGHIEVEKVLKNYRK